MLRNRMLLLMMAMLLLGACKARQVPDLPLKSLSSYSGGTLARCRTKDRCVFVYLTPWCPHCVGSAPLVSALRLRAQQTGKTAVIAIVGGDTPEKVRAMGQRIGSETLLDYDQTFHRAMGVGGVPAWWVTDNQGKVLHGLSGGIGAADDNTVKYFIEQHLQLTGYL
jgi:hypothetical protein